MNRDPLLTSGKVLTTIFMVLLGILVIGMPLAIVAILANPDLMVTEFGARPIDATKLNVFIVVLLIGFMAMGIVGLHFLRLLRRMIDSVSEGDPFARINAERLSRMGWLVLGVQGLGLVMSGFAEYVVTAFPDDDLSLDIDLSLEGILLAVVLFILARVFRTGAEMRDDLEGTV